jgi:metallo-beta-lactamase family protein
MQSTITFCGGAGAVTGSNFLLDTGNNKLLIDCGLRQGRHSAEEENWNEFSYDPKNISHLIVTHAHIDHIGRIPKLVRDGFAGKILSTEATKALAEPLLLDSQELLDHAAKRHGVQPLYTEADITRAMSLWEGIPYHKGVELPDGITLEFLNSGHILGSAMAKFARGGKTIMFTGDLGGGNSPLLEAVEETTANYLVMESVYGDRVRPDDKDRREMLENIIEDGARRGGTLLIPAFSTERTQDLLFEIRTLMIEKRVPSMPVYLDSPLAEKMTDAYLAFPSYFAPAIRTRVEAGEKIFSFPEMTFVDDIEESRKVDRAPGPKILIAGSGMSNGGRVQSHEATVLPDEKSTVLVVGYQAAGSLGRRLVEGLKEVEIQRQKVPVRARVEELYGYSAHMDGEQLLEFANKVAESRALTQVFVVMGEPASSAFLAQRITDYLGVKATVPEAGQSVTIEL